MDPRLFSDSDAVGSDRSLPPQRHERGSRRGLKNAYQKRTILSELPEISRRSGWRTWKLFTKSACAFGVDESSCFVCQGGRSCRERGAMRAERREHVQRCPTP